MRLRSYHRLLVSLLIVFGILSMLLALAQDQHTIKVESAYGAEDPKFASPRRSSTPSQRAAIAIGSWRTAMRFSRR
ncbi:MAG: hypothetical protein DMF86_16905 [Acidobacteria bacterium]|nr:MAG: hypothetical protein DMF86_16905 [Acidobacteriota bacterium]